jgi:hypothetical protein
MTTILEKYSANYFQPCLYVWYAEMLALILKTLSLNVTTLIRDYRNMNFGTELVVLGFLLSASYSVFIVWNLSYLSG